MLKFDKEILRNGKVKGTLVFVTDLQTDLQTRRTDRKTFLQTDLQTDRQKDGLFHSELFAGRQNLKTEQQICKLQKFKIEVTR